ncbi:hypothetical protein HOLleu_32636 [Holothuria leucospilota]|uniref:Ashwin n=1 Tax=Holothuria leucospilota TaxID=206669 RepID=A0A9Q1BIZ3_HOLLE|nr:hypothetical protein HOLleu_32636 [Holothuria leucospilota]
MNSATPQFKMATSTEDDVQHPLDMSNPELLSKEDLIRLLKERHIKIEEAQVDKAKLVNLFQRTLMPLPQRVPRNNRRGKRTKALIKKLDALKPKNEKAQNAVEYQNPKKKKTSEVKKGLLISSELNLSSGPRLKPPPVVINKKRAVIKLGSSTPTRKHSDKNVATIRTGLSKVKLSPASGKTDSEFKLNKETKTSSPQESIQKPGRVKITFAETKDNKPQVKENSTTKQHGLLISTKQSLSVSKSKESSDHSSAKTGRVKITFDLDNDKSKTRVTSLTRSHVVSDAGKNAVRKALGHLGHGEKKRKDGENKTTIKRPITTSVTESKDAPNSKRKKISWP